MNRSLFVLLLSVLVASAWGQEAPPAPAGAPTGDRAGVPMAPASPSLYAPPAGYQSSSLYLTSGSSTVRADGKVVNPYMQQASYLAVAIPEPREFQVHDLITIVVRQIASGAAEGELNTKKKVTVAGEAAAFIDLGQLLQARVVPTALSAGVPRVEVGFDNKFEGDGDYDREDEVVTRLTAEVVDVKPNGTLALQARMYMANDAETVTIAITGYCRAEDVAADNTILSTQLHDLRIDKQHTGEIRDASRKGVLTKAMEYLFNF